MKKGTLIRVVVSTDFPPLDCRYPFPDQLPDDHKSDPDDLQSMVHFLLCSNEFDVEGLIASAATFAGVARKANILDMIDEYAKVYLKLAAADSDYPTPDELRAITYQGNDGTWGSEKEWDTVIGEGKDSEASRAIIDIVDKEDERPVWFCIWGDNTNIAQAIWRVQQERTEEKFNMFISKMRIFQIAQQDSTINWMMEKFPNLFIVYSKSTYLGICKNNADWVQKNVIEGHGALGAAYPQRGMASNGVTEGDSPSFLYLLSAAKGLSNSEDPTGESWGGQYKLLEGTKHYVDGPGAISISKWNEDIQKDFEERLALIADEIEER